MSATAVLIDVHQGTPEWLEAKQDTLGGSEIACAAGLSRYVTPEDLLKFKQGLIPEPKELTNAMTLGVVFEPKISDELGKYWKVPLLTQQMYIHKYIPWLSISPDRLMVFSPRQKMYVEIKYKVYSNMLYTLDHPEIEHLCQIQHQMFILQLQSMWIVYGNEHLHLRIFEVYYNATFYSWLLKRLTEFRRCWKNPSRPTLSYGPEVYAWTSKKIKETFQMFDHGLIPYAAHIQSMTFRLKR